MSNPSKAKGTAAEMAVVKYLERVGLDVWRPALQGTNDLGDVHYRNRHGHQYVVSVKGGRAAEIASPEQIAKWCQEVEAQAARVQAAQGVYGCFVVTKRAGVGGLRAELWRAHDSRGGHLWSADLATMVEFYL